MPIQFYSSKVLKVNANYQTWMGKYSITNETELNWRIGCYVHECVHEQAIGQRLLQILNFISYFVLTL